jgi:hypothetical protein
VKNFTSGRLTIDPPHEGEVEIEIQNEYDLDHYILVSIDREDLRELHNWIGEALKEMGEP